VFGGKPLDTIEDLCFVLMPFLAPWSREVYETYIKVVQEAGLTCERADDIFSPNVIMEDIWEQINKAAILIADLTTIAK
jgi:hypothetical protein